MTVAPTLQKGLKRLFSSSALQIIAIALMIIGLIITIIGLGAALATAGSTGSLVAAGGGAILMTIIAPILVIIAAILSLVGIINVSKENSKFKTALYAVLANIVLVIIAMFVGQNPTVATIIDLLANICNIVMFLFICGGIYAVGEKLGRTDFLGRYNTIVIFYALGAVLALVGGFMNPLSTIAYVLQIIGQICSFISYILYMGYLRKAIKAVEGVPTAEPQQI